MSAYLSNSGVSPVGIQQSQLRRPNFGLVPTRSASLNAPKTDVILFSGNKTPEFNIDDVVTVIKPDEMPSWFPGNVKQGTEQALHSLPKPLLQDALAHGFRVLAVPEFIDCLNDDRFLETYICKIEQRLTSEHIEESFIKSNGAYEHFKMYCSNLSDGPLKERLGRYLNLNISSQGISRRAAATIIAVNDLLLSSYPSPVYITGTGTVIVPIEVVDSSSPWNNLEKSPERIESVTRHEFFHFVDMEFGRRLTGNNFSYSEVFQWKTSEDMFNGFDSNNWPGYGAVTDEGIPLGHYFLGNDNQAENLQEAFAECGSHNYGGGAVPADLMNRTYIESAKYVRELIDRYWGNEM